MSDQKARIPGAAKVFPFITVGLFFILSLFTLSPLIPGNSNYYLPFLGRFLNNGMPIKVAAVICCMLMFAIVIGVLVYGIGTAIGKPIGAGLSAAGLLIIAILRLVRIATNNMGTRYYILYSILLVCLILCTLYFLLKGNGINWIVKLVAAALGILVTAIMLILSISNMSFSSGTGWILVRVLLEDIGYIFLWISVLLNTPFKKGA